MWNYNAIDKTPTVAQVKAIIDYMENDQEIKYNFGMMMGMERPKPNKIKLDLNDAGFGIIYEIIFNDDGNIKEFKEISRWMS